MELILVHLPSIHHARFRVPHFVAMRILVVIFVQCLVYIYLFLVARRDITDIFVLLSFRKKKERIKRSKLIAYQNINLGLK